MSEEFWQLVCVAAGYVRALLFVTVVLLVLLLMAFPFITPGSESYYVSIANFVGIIVLLVNCAYIIIRCNRRDTPVE